MMHFLAEVLDENEDRGALMAVDQFLGFRARQHLNGIPAVWPNSSLTTSDQLRPGNESGIRRRPSSSSTM